MREADAYRLARQARPFRASASSVIRQAAREFPDLDDTVMALCR